MTIEFIFPSEKFDEKELKAIFRNTSDYQHSNITIDADTVLIYPEDLADMSRTRKCLIEAIDYAIRKGEE